MTSALSGRYLAPSDLPDTLGLFPLPGVILLPRAELPLNVFEPRYLALIDAALAGSRLIGIVQPSGDPDTELRPPLMDTGCVGRLVGFQEAGDGRYLIHLRGVCRFALRGEVAGGEPFRIARADYAPFAGDLLDVETPAGFPRERLLSALRDYLDRRDLKADWKSVTNAPAEGLVNALAMMCPFDPAEKQALLAAPGFEERVSVLIALLEMGVADTGPQSMN